MKKILKKIGRHAWELFKACIPAALMYFCAGTVLWMLTMKGDSATDYTWDNTKLIWTIVCIVVAGAYNGLIGFAQGGTAYEMLVSGNMKRMSAADFEGGYKISSHKEAKEYRPWKGFVSGAYIALFTIAAGIVFGVNGARIDGVFGGDTWGTGLGVTVIVFLLLSGWSVLPFFYLHGSGFTVSYYVSIVFALLPIIISGVFYIIGAYAKRNKTIRAQEMADRAAAAQEAKPKKINYGGLPGTKPKKRK